MRPGHFVALAVLLTAGCVDGSATEDGGAPPTSASVTTETGGIQGKVMTDELQPIPKAQVGLLPTQQNATSGSDGSFAFSDLPAGQYKIVVVALGYYQATRSIDVVVGEVAPADVILDRVPTSLPSFQEILKFTGTLPASDLCQTGYRTDQTKDIAWRDHEITINESKDGEPIAAVFLDIDLKSVNSPGSVDVDLYFFDAARKEIASSHTAAPDEHIEYEKYLKAGKYYVQVWICTGVDVDYAAKVTLTYEHGDLARAIQEGKKKV